MTLILIGFTCKTQNMVLVDLPYIFIPANRLLGDVNTFFTPVR